MATNTVDEPLSAGPQSLTILPDPETRPLLPNGSTYSAIRQYETLPLTKTEESSLREKDEVSFFAETRLIVKHASPLICTYLLQYFYQLIIVLVASQLSTDELAAVSLGITTSNVVGYAIFEGLATALDTLCAQAYGSGQPEMVGVHMVRFIIFVHLVALPLGALWLSSPWFLPILVPGRELAQNAGAFLRWSVIGVPGYASFEAGKRFMQAQGNFTSGLVVLVACLPLSGFLNWLLVFQLDLRIPGAALAAALTNLARPFLLLLYATVIKPSTLRCWPSSSLLTRRTVFSNWKPMVRLAIPGAIMALAEWFAFEIGTFATSYAGTAALAAQSFLTTSAVVVWHVPFAASIVLSTRLGQLVGGGYIATARKVSGWYVSLFSILGMLDVMLMFGALQLVVHHLALDASVANEVRQTLPYAVVFVYFDCLATGVHGIVRGLGWQSIGGWVTMSCNYLYAVPLALFLELGPPVLGLQGLWMAMASGLAVLFVVEGLVVRARNWDGLLNEANKRLER